MSNLTPVYQQLKPSYSSDEEEAIQLEDFPKEQDNQQQIESNQNQDSKCSGTKCRKSLVHRLCGCIALFMGIGFLIYILVGIGSVTYLMVKTHQCIHPPHHEIIEYTFTSDEIKELDLHIVSGHITVRQSDQIDHVQIRLRKGASQFEALNYMVPQTKLENHRFELHVESPSFDWHSCHVTDLEVLIPSHVRLAPLEFSASVLFGRIDFRPVNVHFKNVNLYSRLGGIQAKHSKVVDRFSAEATVGVVQMVDIHGTSISANVGTGLLFLHDSTSLVTQIEVTTGGAVLAHNSAKQVAVEADMAYIHIHESYHTEHVDAKVNYGELTYVPETFQGRFNVESPFGYVSAISAEDTQPLVFEAETLAKLSGQSLTEELKSTLREEDYSKLPSLNLHSIYGNVALFIPHAHNEHFYKHHDHQKFPFK